MPSASRSRRIVAADTAGPRCPCATSTASTATRSWRRLTQPNVDRATLEDLRRAELQLAESASSRIVTALADIADVLTPEQRAELVKMAERFRR